MKKVAAVLGVICLLCLTYVLIIYYPIIYPYGDFQFQLKHNRFSIYSDQQISDETVTILDDVSQRLSLVGIDNPDRQFEIFICNEPALYIKFAELAGRSGRSQGMNIQPFFYTFINTQFIEEIGNEFRDVYPHSLLQGDQAHIITHELIHEIIAHETGLYESRSLPSWKVEGYAEYYASQLNRKSDAGYSFETQVEKYFDGELNNLSPGRFHYIQSLIVVEYLISEKNLPFEEIFNPALTFEEVDKELLSWHLGSGN